MLQQPNRITLPHLTGRPERCSACPLRSPTITYSGNPEAPLVAVGESPGGLEVAKNEPFVGDSGALLRRAFPPDVDPDSYMLTNAQQCYPPKEKDIKMLAACSRACRGRLIEEILQHPREVILAIGNSALWSLTNDFSLKITQERGKRFTSPLARQGIIAAYHPSYVLRGGGSYKIFREDVRYAFSLLSGGPKIPKEFKFEVVEPTPTGLEFLVNELETKREVGADTETSSLNPRQGRILCSGLNFGDETTYVIRPENLPFFAPIFDIKEAVWIWHNGKFDIAWYRLLGLPARVDEDTMLLSYALNEMGGIHDLETVARDLLGAPDYKNKLSQWVKTKSDSFELVPFEELCRWRLAPDCGYTLQAWRILRARVRIDPNLEKLYTRLLIPASDLLHDVEARGFYVNQEQLERNLDHYAGNASKGIEGVVPKLAEEINQIVRSLGESDINPNSWQQVSHILYDVVGLTNKWRSRGTDESILKANIPHHPITDSILKYREVAKAYGTYVKGISKRVDGDGCIHSTYKIHGTRTGRLSSSDPNLQNIPRDPILRSTFGARPGHILLEFDLDQAELRCLGALSGDTALCHIYEHDGLSLHKEVSQWLWENDWKARYARGDLEGGEHDPIFLAAYEEYMRTKALNFGIVYGREANSIAEEFKVPVSEAQKWVDKWFIRFPKAKEYIDACRRAPIQGKTLVTVFGRKKRFGAVSAARIRSLQNEAANFPHQSCASDITLDTAIKVYKRLEAIAAYIVNLVHDSLVVECPNDPQTIQAVRDIVEPEMRKTPIEWGLDRIPFKTDCKVGSLWGLGKKLKEAA